MTSRVPNHRRSSLNRLLVRRTAGVSAGVGLVLLVGWWVGVASELLLVGLGLVSGLLLRPRKAAGSDRRELFERELERARRFGCLLTLVRVPGAGERTMAWATNSSGLDGLVRRVDLAWLEGDDLYLTLFDTGVQGARLVLDRLERRGVDVSDAGLSVFPESALTAGAMHAQVTAPDGPRVLAPEQSDPQLPLGLNRAV